jgi:hypothetical protein
MAPSDLAAGLGPGGWWVGMDIQGGKIKNTLSNPR